MCKIGQNENPFTVILQIMRGRTAWQCALLRGVVACCVIGAILTVIGVGVLVGKALVIGANLPSIGDALDTPSSEATRVYAADGQLIASLYQENRDSIPLSQVPRLLQRAVIDTEDADFYRHHGVSLRAVVRAGFRDMREKGYAEGGSTITQQLARNLFLTSAKSIERKIAEVLLAVQVERRLTKDEILERYLNQVYFGQEAYGVETAAHVYFGKPAQDLTLAQSVVLAGLIQAPSRYSPFEHPSRARARMAEVLQRMVDQGDLTPREMADALHAPLGLTDKGKPGSIGNRAPYFVSYILPMLRQRYGEEVLYKGGLRIYTTLDVTLQAEAEAALRQGIDEALRRHLTVHQGAIVVLDPRTGYIRAMIGGYDFQESKFNRAWQAHRQPGSAFKPFLYTTAIMRGFPLTKMLLDAPIEFTEPGGKVWAPKDFDRTWHGLVTMRYALENSINVASIRLEQEVGPEAVVEVAHWMGIKSPLLPVLSLTLGSNDVTLLEMVSAYGVFANGGVRSAPVAILKVTDRHGKVLEDPVPLRRSVLTPEVAYLMTDLLKGVMLRGTGTAANIGIPAAGKTGTADDYRNAWFIGFTPYLVAGVFIGNDDDSPMNHVVGGSVPARIWAAFMKQATADQPKDDWPLPDGIAGQVLCGTSGLLAASGCVSPHSELFVKGTEPASYDLTDGRPDPAGGGPTPPAGGAPVPDLLVTATAQTVVAQPAAAQGGPPAAVPWAAGGALPLIVTVPREGSQVTVPFLVQGTTRSGAVVHIVVLSEIGALRIQAADVSIRADQAGGFVYEVTPWARPAGGRLVITATATVGLDAVPASISVQPR